MTKYMDLGRETLEDAASIARHARKGRTVLGGDVRTLAEAYLALLEGAPGAEETAYAHERARYLERAVRATVNAMAPHAIAHGWMRPLKQALRWCDRQASGSGSICD